MIAAPQPPRFRYYNVRCRECGATMVIGDTRSAEEIRALLESGEALSGHAAECNSGWGRAPLAFEITVDESRR